MKPNTEHFNGAMRFVLFALLIVILFCAIGLVSYYNSSNALYSSISQSFENRAIDSSKLLSKAFEEKIKALEIVAVNSEIRSMNWELQRSNLLNYLDELEVKRIQVIDKTGFARSTDGISVNLSDRAYFKKAMSGVSNISDVLKSRFDGKMVIVCAVPIRNEYGDIVGVLSDTVDYQILRKLIDSINVGSAGYAYMINKDGLTIAHPKQDHVLMENALKDDLASDSGKKELAQLQSKMVEGVTGSGFYKYDDIEKYQAFTPVPNTSWFLALTIPKSEIFSKIDSLRSKFIIETLIFILSTLLLFYLILVYSLQRRKVSDIQRKTEESYKHLAELTELDRLKTEFIANISHELRTPLNVILTTLQLFEVYIKGDLEKNLDSIRKYSKTMKQNCYRLLRLINNVIDITKFEAGYYDLRLHHVNIINLVEEVALSVADFANEKGIYLQFDTEVEEKIILCDSDKIERIMLNLLSNAIKFSKSSGSILVNIYEKGDKIEISVKDNGIGIPKDKLGLIFERFKQIEQTLTRKHEGSGIGLSIVKSLVEMHKGEIRVESEEGVGSEFIIVLPAVKESVDDLDEENNCYYVGDKVKIELSDI